MSEARDPLDWLEAERHRLGGSRVAFQRQLEDCTRTLIELGEEITAAIEPVTTAFLEADHHRAEQAIAADEHVDRRCLELEDACYLLLARQSPVSGDLRRIVATLRCVGDIQRSGDLLKHVAESLAWVHPPALPADVRDTLAQLGAATTQIFAGAVQAWRDHDGLAAVELQRTDDEVDLLQKLLLTDIYTGQRSVEEAVSLALIARYYERIADHGVEMARQVTYFVTGDRITDEGP
jgi:phosphate transport system protein